MRLKIAYILTLSHVYFLLSLTVYRHLACRQGVGSTKFALSRASQLTNRKLANDNFDRQQTWQRLDILVYRRTHTQTDTHAHCPVGSGSRAGGSHSGSLLVPSRSCAIFWRAREERANSLGARAHTHTSA